ncbi:carboxylesterase family protein [Actinomadura yumaensis]|uniref:carboxylesterase family protein n=1 Tax=Actinomadura yumaensis TaxID=111807 RepID=UPI0036176F42
MGAAVPRRPRRASGEEAEALMSAPAEALVAAEHTLTRRNADAEPGTRATAPLHGDDVLPRYPLDVFADGAAHPVPLLIGTTAHEGRMFPLLLDILPTDRARIEKMFNGTDPEVKARALAAYPGYPGRRAAADLGGDIVFWEPSVLCAQGHAPHAPTYAYRYDYAPRLLDLTGMRATHGTDLLALFGAGDGRAGRAATLLGGRAGLRAVTRTVQDHWLAFVRDGAPGPSWPAYTARRRETLIIDEASRVVDDPNAERRRAWIGYRHRR